MQPFHKVLTLSEREYEVLCLAGQGLAMKEIAAHLGVHYGTVSTYYDKLRLKLNLDSYLQLAVYGAQYLATGQRRQLIPNRPIIRKAIENRPLRFRFVPREPNVVSLKVA